MNYIEKLGLIIIIAFFTKDWPVSWKGGEVAIAMFGSLLFIGGAYIQSWITAFQEV